VREGAPLLTLHTDTAGAFPSALEALQSAFTVSPQGTDFTPGPIVLDRVAG
jgi:thymidine phosphorylase